MAPAFAEEVFGVGKSGYGFLVSAFGLGAIAGTERGLDVEQLVVVARRVRVAVDEQDADLVAQLAIAHALAGLFVARLHQLATTDETLGRAKRLGVLFDEYYRVAEELLRLSDRLRAAVDTLSTERSVLTGEAARVELAVVRELVGLVSEATEERRRPGENADAAGGGGAATLGPRRRVLAMSRELRAALARLADLHSQIDDLLDQGVQEIVEHDLTLARTEALLHASAAERSARIIGVVLVSTATLGAVILIVGVRRPLRALMEATEKVASGDLELSVPEYGTDEFADMARRFNRMTAALRESTVSRSALAEVVTRLEAEVESRRLLVDFLNTPSLADSEVVLVDVVADSLPPMLELAEHLVAITPCADWAVFALSNSGRTASTAGIASSHRLTPSHPNRRTTPFSARPTSPTSR